MADEITVVPGAGKGTPQPVEAKADEPMKPRSTAQSILEANRARRAKPIVKPELKSTPKTEGK